MRLNGSHAGHTNKDKIEQVNPETIILLDIPGIKPKPTLKISTIFPKP